MITPIFDVERSVEAVADEVVAGPARKQLGQRNPPPFAMSRRSPIGRSPAPSVLGAESTARQGPASRFSPGSAMLGRCPRPRRPSPIRHIGEPSGDLPSLGANPLLHDLVEESFPVSDGLIEVLSGLGLASPCARIFSPSTRSSREGQGGVAVGSSQFSLPSHTTGHRLHAGARSGGADFQ